MQFGNAELQETYHISDEFFQEVFQKFLRGEQRGLVQLLLPEVVVVVHWLWENTTKEVSNKNKPTPF